MKEQSGKIRGWSGPPESLSEDSRCPSPHWDYHKKRRAPGPVRACRLHRWANRRWYEGLKGEVSG